MDRLKSTLLTAATFGATGPVFGTLAYAAWGFVLLDEGPGIGSSLLGALWLIPFGYVVGFLPAVAAGLITGLLGRGLGVPLFIGLGMFAGATVMGITAGLLASPPELSEGVVNLVAIGAIAGG